MNLKKLLATGSFLFTSLTFLTGCDNSKDVILDELNFNNGSNVKLIKEIKKADDDAYRIEVYDDKGMLRLKYKDGGDYIIIHEKGKTYTPRENTINK